MRKVLKTICVLSIVGTLFAAAVTMRQYVAPAQAPGIFSCVGFKIWGLSPCPYGLTIFALLAFLSIFLYRSLFINLKLLMILRTVALGGVVFSGWVGWRELVLPALARGASYWQNFNPWAVPACVWGFLVFLAVAILSFIYKPKTI